MVTASAIATLIVFMLSIVCVIHPFSIPIFGGRRFPVNLTTAPIIAILVLWASQCLIAKNIRDGIVGTDGVQPYNILILFFSLAYMAITLDATGVLQAAAFWVSNKGGSNGWKLFTYFYIMLTVLSVILGNDPVILSGTVFLVYYTQVNELNHIAWLISEFAAANTASMVLFVGNPTNVVICEGFKINNAAFTAYTILPFLACSVTCFFALAAQFHHSKYLPRQLNVSGNLNVRAVLLDPKGAIVGSFLLGSCLVVVVMVSFFHVDVWKITLPFAIAKFIFDIAWDSYRIVKGISMGGHSMARKSDDDLAGLEDDLIIQELQRSRATVPADRVEAQHEIPVKMRGNSENHYMSPSSIQTNDHVGTSAANPISPSKSLRKVAFPQSLFFNVKQKHHKLKRLFSKRLPTLYTAFPRLPFGLVPFAFSQFILIEALAHQGWIDIFGRWLVIASGRRMYPTIWLIGVLGVVLCNCSGTNIGATILLTKVVRKALLSTAADATNVNLDAFNRSAAIALAVSSNIGAVSFTFNASLAGLLWAQILKQKRIPIKQQTFARWNVLPLVVMTAVGLGVVCAEMAVLF